MWLQWVLACKVCFLFCFVFNKKTENRNKNWVVLNTLSKDLKPKVLVNDELRNKTCVVKASKNRQQQTTEGNHNMGFKGVVACICKYRSIQALIPFEI